MMSVHIDNTHLTLNDRKWLLMKRLQKRDYELDVNLRGSVSPLRDAALVQICGGVTLIANF